MKGYGESGASHQKKALKGFTAQSGSTREDIDFNNFTLRQRGRILYQASPIAASAIKTNRTNVVGMGLQLRSRIDKEALGVSQEYADIWEKNVEREFSLWAENKRNCDATGINNFNGMQQLAFISWLMSGDCIAAVKQFPTTPLSPYSTRIHIIEADRISTPGPTSLAYTTGINPDNGNTIYDGIEVDGNGAILAYHIRNTHPFEFGEPNVIPNKWIRVPAYQPNTGLPNIIHCSESERPDQYRGITYLAQVIEPLLQIRRYTEAELTAAVVEASITAFIKTESDTTEMPFNETSENEMYDPNEYSIAPGQINVMNPGESVDFLEPKRPAGGFPAFIKSMSEQIGSALEIPSDLLLKSFNASYSASRAALLEAWKSFKMRREWFADDFCRPIYEIWLSEAIARGRVVAPGFFSNPIIRKAYLGSEWLGPSQGQLDPVKEVEAEILACSEGFSTHEQSTVKLNGGQWSKNVERLKRENEALRDAKIEPTAIQGGESNE